MPRKEYKYHFIYKTTCLLNEQYYVGMHSTFNLEDEYLGSGKRLGNSVKKHGKENFKREILEHFENREELKKREAELVDDDLLKDPLCMNLQHGGGGGFSSKEHMMKCSNAGHVALKHKLKNDSKLLQQFKDINSVNFKSAHANGKIKYDNFKDKHHSEKTKQQIGKTNSIKQAGNKNSQYGTCWITNEKENKKIHKGDLIPIGWRLGRLL